ncbi:arylesterase [Ectothiorhodospiraceae bacterium 2226]|nr:arylesterase [Ectothiorhodospiraceae bacterium 2226]
MRRLLIVVLWLGWLVAPPVGADEPPVILVLGDSLSAAYGMDTARAWPQLLQARLRAEGYPHRVINLSVSGETTQGGLARLPQALAEHRPRLVVLQLGGNDGLRGLPVEAMRDNLARMIADSRSAGADVLLVGVRLPPNYGMTYTQRFHNVYVDLAEQVGVPLVPFILEGVAGRIDMMQHDGVHPTPAAQPQVLNNVWPHLEPLLAPAATSSRS